MCMKSCLCCVVNFTAISTRLLAYANNLSQVRLYLNCRCSCSCSVCNATTKQVLSYLDEPESAEKHMREAIGTPVACLLSLSVAFAHVCSLFLLLHVCVCVLGVQTQRLW